MGRIKTTLIKRKTKELLKMYGEKFTPEFSQNKELTGKFMNISSKKMRNVIAGYMTRLKHKEA
jgi:small subunit ribosomal protein S17e